MSIEIENEANAVFEFDYEEIIRKVIEYSLDYVKCPYETEVNVTLVSNEEIQKANAQFRNIDKATDVLSFPFIEYDTPGDFSHVEECTEEYFNPQTGELVLGDILLSADKIKEQALEYGHAQSRELGFLVAHSMLHLFGYDHIKEEEAKRMEKKQTEILDYLQIKR